MSRVCNKRKFVIKMSQMTFPEYLEEQFVEWQRTQGKRKTIEDFAIYLGVSRPLLNMWLNGNRKPGVNSLKLLSTKLGMKIYDVLELPRPNPLHLYAERNWDKAPKKVQQELAKIISKYTDEPIPDETREKQTTKP